MNINSGTAPHLNSFEFNIAQWLTAPVEPLDQLQQLPAISESSVNQSHGREVSSTSSSDISQFRKLLRKVTYNIEFASENQSFSSPMKEMKQNASTVPVSKRPSWGSPEVEATDAEGSSLRRLWVNSPSKAWQELFNIPYFPEEEFKKVFQMSKTNFRFSSGQIRPSPKDVCVCVDGECSHVACRPVIEFLVEVLYASFIFQVSELIDKFQKHLLDILDKAVADDVLIILSIANVCGTACERLLGRCIEVIVKSDVDIITLDKALPHHIVKQIIDARKELGLQGPDTNSFPDKHVKRIHRALDSDDVELVRMLLKEGHTMLDDACALHYAVAYCDVKTTTELLDLGLADVNHRNPRGYTVLHVAAMRKEPKIIVSLLTKGARPSDLTSDGRKALQISKRLTRALDYQKPMEEGKVSPKDQLCIEILEQAERRYPLLGEASVSLAMACDALQMKLLYLENRVGLTKLLFPMEAIVAMDIAQVDGTSEFPMDLNEAPFKIKDEHLNRMRVLSKTVELGKSFFPRCCAVLNKIMDGDDLSEMAYVGNETPEERQLKKQRYMELQEVLTKAFSEDKQEFDKNINISSSSSSTSMEIIKSNMKLAFRK